MGVARDFGLWALNAREFRRAGLNPRWWLARRVNQSATDGMGGVVIFRVKRRGLLPAGRRRLSPGSADPLSSTVRIRTPPHHCVVRPADPLSSTVRTPPHHCVVRPADALSSTDPLFLLRRGPLPTIPSSVDADPLSPSARTPSLPRTPLSTAADPSPLFRRPSTRTPSPHRRGPPLFHGPPLSTAADHRPGGADPLSSTDPSFFTAADPGCASFAAHGGGGGASGMYRSKWCER
ncbi:hypothetical protein niasHT_032059 [Heterodera trifolii]|uniref:Uncharacterized protein n=1 Tax=Heterodera trifolii TaxID=157864 RepID=A0ABD2I9P0_9BILA